MAGLLDAGRVLMPQRRAGTTQEQLDQLALASSPVPVAGDIMGLLSDAYRYATDPSARTPTNYGMSALGLLPFVPSMVGGIKNVKPEYGIVHRPMQDAGGAARLHDLTPAFGEDIYGKNALQYFGSGDKREASILPIFKSVRGNPDAEVTIYRGVPKDANGINPGDWVTLDKSAAAEYGEKVVAKKVKAKDITSWADSLLEFGYWPHKAGD